MVEKVMPLGDTSRWAFTRKGILVRDLYQEGTEREVYQRHLSFYRVRVIARNWRPELCMPLSVSDRGAKQLVVVDGQHRLVAAVQAQVQELECRIFTHLTYQDEARLFRSLNLASQRITPGELLRASLEAADPVAIAVKTLCARYGFDLDYFVPRTPFVIRCIHTVTALYVDIGPWRVEPGIPHPERLENVLSILREVWVDDLRRTDGDIISGIDHFLQLFATVDRQRLITILNKTTPDLILARTRGANHAGQATRRAYIAAVIWRLFNHELPHRQQLPNAFPANMAATAV